MRIEIPKITNVSLRLIIVWLGITSSVPFIFYSLSWHPYKILALSVSCVAMLDMIASQTFKIKRYQILFFLLNFIANIWLLFWHNDTSYISSFIRVFNSFVFFLYIQNMISINTFAKSVVNVCCVLVGLGIFVLFLGVIGRLVPIGYFISGSRGYFNYFFSFALDYSTYSYGEIVMQRVSSYFDEPGAFALFITFSLIFNKLTDGSKRKERFLLIGGMITFSFAFFVSAILYLMFLAQQNQSIRGLFNQSLVILLSIFVFTALVVSFSTRSSLARFANQVLVQRYYSVKKNTSEIEKKDPREIEFRIAKKQLLHNPLFGKGCTKANQQTEKFGSTILAPLVYNGIFGGILMFLPLFWIVHLCFLKKTKCPRIVLWGVGLIITLNIFQRPFIDMVFIYVALLTSIELIKNKQISC